MKQLSKGCLEQTEGRDPRELDGKSFLKVQAINGTHVFCFSKKKQSLKILQRVQNGKVPQPSRSVSSVFRYLLPKLVG